MIYNLSIFQEFDICQHLKWPKFDQNRENYSHNHKITKFCSFTVRFKYRMFRPLNCISVNVIYKIDCILSKLGYVGSTSKQARTKWAKHKYDIKIVE